MANGPLPESEYILNSDGSIYHLHVLFEHVADTVFLVGDPGRVQQVSRFFDVVEHKIQNREFITHTGVFNGKRLTVMSTGIGTDNIDIVVNELDAAVNIDPVTRQIKTKKRRLNIIRIGTSGSLQGHVPVGSYVISEFGLGLEGLVHYYDYPFNDAEKQLTEKIADHLKLNSNHPKPYVAQGSQRLIEMIGQGMIKGITATASGFYGPQGRRLRLIPKDSDINHRMQSFTYGGYRIINFEMETSAMYALGRMLDHDCCTCCLVLANRVRREYLSDSHSKVDGLIETILNRIQGS